MEEFANIGRSLVAVRRAAGISQRELADAVGTSQQQIARWEAAAYRSASLEKVSRVARALGIGTPAGFVAQEATAVFGAPPASVVASTSRVTPVRDLGEIASRLRACGHELSSVYHLQRIGVFGSFAWGEQTADSDVDLLVDTADPGGFLFISAAGFVSETLGREVDFVRPHLLRDRLRDRVLGEVIYVWSA